MSTPLFRLWVWLDRHGAPYWLWRPYCWLWGHDPGADQCDRPEHDFCVICMKKTPGKAVRP